LAAITGGTGTADRFVTTNADAPIRVTTLDKIDVTNASIAQLNQFVALSADNANQTANQKSRAIADIIGTVEIKDSATNLSASGSTTTFDGATAGTVVDFTTNEDFTIATHGYKTGDAVKYSNGGGTSIGNLTSGSTYYVVTTAANTFKLATTRANAFAGTTINLATGGAGNAHTFTTSALDQAMSKASRLNNLTGSVARVTIAGSGAITSTVLGDIADKAKSGGDVSGGNPIAKITYAAKAVDIQSNLQALNDNIVSTTNTHLSEIVVTDGTVNGKKAINLSYDKYNAMKDIFSAGVTNPLNDANAPTNYAFTVTGASYANSTKQGTPSNPVALQDDKNVAAFSVVGVTKANIDTLAELRDFLGQSKLKTATTESQSTYSWSVAEKTTLTTLLQSIGSGVDRAKLKITA
jgi:hypothetical protein